MTPTVGFYVPGKLSSPTGGYVYARKLLELVPGEGVDLKYVRLPDSFPYPTSNDIRETARILESCQTSILLIDGLAYGAFSDELLAAIRKPVVALVHHPLGCETGLSEAYRETLLRSEKGALARARAVIVTSDFTKRLIVELFGTGMDKLTVIEPGINFAQRARGSGSTRVELLAVGAVSFRKGYSDLIAALSLLAHLPWHLTIVGSLDRTPAAVATLKDQISRAGLIHRVTLAGSIPDSNLEERYAGADIFVSASHFEGYGMVLAEAIARGLPVVASNGGAAGETVPDDAAVKIPPGAVPELRGALMSLISDAGRRRKLSDAAWAARCSLPSWSDVAARMAAKLSEVVSQATRPAVPP